MRSRISCTALLLALCMGASGCAEHDGSDGKEKAGLAGAVALRCAELRERGEGRRHELSAPARRTGGPALPRLVCDMFGLHGEAPY